MIDRVKISLIGIQYCRFSFIDIKYKHNKYIHRVYLIKMEQPKEQGVRVYHEPFGTGAGQGCGNL